MTPEQAQKEIAKELPALARGGSDGAQAESRIVDIVAAQRKISRPEAQAQVTRAKAAVRPDQERDRRHRQVGDRHRRRCGRRHVVHARARAADRRRGGRVRRDRRDPPPPALSVGGRSAYFDLPLPPRGQMRLRRRPIGRPAGASLAYRAVRAHLGCSYSRISTLTRRCPTAPFALPCLSSFR